MLHQGRVGLGVRNNAFSEGAVMHWHTMPREVVGSLSPEVFKGCGGVALRDVISGHGEDWLMVGLDDLSGLFQTLMIL